MHKYFAYGLGIHSDFPIPNFRDSDSLCDVEVRLEPRHCWLQGIQEPYARLGDDVTTLSFEPVLFQVRGGREIRITPVSGADLALVCLYLVGKVMATLLYQRGLLVLHGSSIEINGQVVAFVADSGLGKSSLAASLCVAGHRFVADDVTAVDLGTRPPIAIPGFPQLKIDPEVAVSLGHDRDSLVCLHPMELKRGLRLDDRFAERPLPLSLIYLLGAQCEIPTVPHPHEVLVELLRHSFPARLGQSGGAPHLRQCAALANQVPVLRLPRPASLPRPSELESRIREDLASVRDEAPLQHLRD